MTTLYDLALSLGTTRWAHITGDGSATHNMALQRLAQEDIAHYQDIQAPLFPLGCTLLTNPERMHPDYEPRNDVADRVVAYATTEGTFPGWYAPGPDATRALTILIEARGGYAKAGAKELLRAVVNKETA